MKKLITLLFSIGLVTAAMAQSGGRNRNDSRSNDSRYETNGYPNGYPNQYSNSDPYARNSQWNQRGYNDQYARIRERQRIERERREYEMMMMQREQALRNQRRYNNYSHGPARRPGLQIVIGLGGRRGY